MTAPMVKTIRTQSEKHFLHFTRTVSKFFWCFNPWTGSGCDAECFSSTTAHSKMFFIPFWTFVILHVVSGPLNFGRRYKPKEETVLCFCNDLGWSLTRDYIACLYPSQQALIPGLQPLWSTWTASLSSGRTAPLSSRTLCLSVSHLHGGLFYNVLFKWRTWSSLPTYSHSSFFLIQFLLMIIACAKFL